MKFRRFTFKFKDGELSVYALHYDVAKILAQAHAIERGWDYTIL